MPPKGDIRSFFTRPAPPKAKDPEAAEKPKPKATPSKRAAGSEAAEDASKRSKFFEQGSSSSRAKAKSPAKAPAGAAGAQKGSSSPGSAGKGKGAAEKKPSLGGAGGAKGKGKPKRRADSDDDDSDFEIKETPSEDDEDMEAIVLVDSDEEDEEDVKSKAATKRQKQAAPKAAPVKKAPQPKKTPAAKKASGPELSDDAAKAVAAVEGAIMRLPPQSEVKFSIMASTGGWGQRPPDEPANHGAKDPPLGHSECLTGLTFVVSGVLDSLRRDEAEEVVKRHGGRVTGNVSKKTSFLLVGTDCGNSKHSKAVEVGVPLIDEDGLRSLIAAAPAQAEQPEPAPSPVAPASATPAAAPTAAGPSSSASSWVKSLPRKAPGPQQAPPASSKAPMPPPGPREPSGLWVDRHKPSGSRDLVGNNTLVGTLRAWLGGWQAQFLEGKPPPKGSSQSRKIQEAMSKRAVLLSGPPGIGKTSSAMIVCRELGFDPVEVNASDTRNTSDSSALKGINGKMSNVIKELSTNTAMGVGGACGASTGRKTVIIMDEVDGMSGSDRGGISDLIKIIAKAKVPIVCICNDKYSQKLKSLRNHTMELDYKRPTTQAISKRMLDIARAEGLQVNEASMNALVEGANGDLRAILGQLQMIRLRKRTLSYDDAKAKFGTSKDANLSPFTAAQDLLDPKASQLRLGDQLDLVFQDMDLVPLLVQENYLNHRPKIAGDDMQRLMCMAKASDGLSYGDVVNNKVRRYQNWSLMPFAAAIGSVMPATYVRGFREPFGLFPGEQNFPRFTAWLGNNSTANKQKRVLGELHTLMSAGGHCSADRAAVRQSYLPVMRSVLTKPLRDRGQDAIPEVIEIMHEYCISREEYDNLLDITKFKSKASWAEDPMKEVPTATKSAFTRAFNKSGMKARTTMMVEEQTFKKGGSSKAAKKGKKKAAAPGDAPLTEGDPEFGEEKVKLEDDADEDEDEDDREALREKLKNRGGVQFEAAAETKGKGKGKASGSRGGGRGGARGGRGGRK